MSSIIQWNCRGLKPNYDEVSLLLTSHNPAAMCLQETFLKDTDTVSFKRHSIYNTVYTGGDKASGGVSVIVNNSIPHKHIALQTDMQAVAVSLTMHRIITLCSVYIPPKTRINPAELDNLVSQLPSPFLLVGDFNSHNTIWGCKDTNDKGKAIENLICKQNLCLLNDRKSHTYLHPASGSYSSIDLSLCSPTLYMDFSWKVGDDLCGSDHFPIFLFHNGPSQQRVQRWKLHKADWSLFQYLCEERIKPDTFTQCDDPIDSFTAVLHAIASECIPKT